MNKHNYMMYLYFQINNNNKLVNVKQYKNQKNYLIVLVNNYMVKKLIN